MKLIYLIGLLLSTHSIQQGKAVENATKTTKTSIQNAGGNAPEMQIREKKDASSKVFSTSSKQCTRSSKLDLQLIVDSSESIGEKSFHKTIAGIADMISQFDIAKDKTRVALFKYSSENIMVREIRLNSYDNAADLKAAIKSIEFQRGMTFTATAMEKALAHYKTGMRDDGKTAKVCIVFTDGDPTEKTGEKERVPAASKAWAGIGAKVFAVGIGSKIMKKGLEAIAGSDEQIMNVANFESIGRKAKSLLGKVCRVMHIKATLEQRCDGGTSEMRRNGVTETLEGTDECEKVLKCYERCNPACSRSQLAKEECRWPMLKYWLKYDQPTICVRDCGKDTGIECPSSSYNDCNRPSVARSLSLLEG